MREISKMIEIIFPIMYLACLFLSMVFVELIRSEKILGKLTRDFIYEKTKFCFHNDNVLAEDQDMKIPIYYLKEYRKKYCIYCKKEFFIHYERYNKNVYDVYEVPVQISEIIESSCRNRIQNQMMKEEKEKILLQKQAANVIKFHKK